MLKIGPESAVVIGASAGGVEALRTVLCELHADFAAPVFVVQHFPAEAQMLLPSLLAKACRLVAREAVDKERAVPGCIYFAPPGYHLHIERDRTLALSVDEPEHFSRPSINVLFESASRAYGDTLVAIVLTGANSDGAEGLRAVKARGGTAIVQDPDTAEAKAMPEAAICATEVDMVLNLKDIGRWLYSHQARKVDDAE